MINEPLQMAPVAAPARVGAPRDGGRPTTNVTPIRTPTPTPSTIADSPASAVPALTVDLFRHPDASASAPNALRNRLVRMDAAVVTVVWGLVLLVPGPRSAPVLRSLVGIVAATALSLLALAMLQLYRSRFCADRRTTRRRLAVASFVAPAVLVVVGVAPGGLDLWSAHLIAGCVAAFVGLATGREVFEQWLRGARARGHHVRPVLVSGGRDEVAQIVRLLDAHPEVGCRAVARVGPRPDAPSDPDLALVPWMGDASRIVEATALTGVTGVVVTPTATSDPGFNELARDLHAHGIHVQLSSGLWGIDPCRLRAVALAHEPFFYLEPLHQGSGRRRMKRIVDVLIASLLLIVTAPVTAVAALLVKLHDGGPVLFRQVRIGLGGEPFELHKFRTMTVDAESQLADLAQHNERSGPLFKIDIDPRVTPVGRILRATSIDELPQLIDVLAGRLSLVGPRPALPNEVAAFDEALLDRHRVLPGVTGLWQVEARHNPSFDAYRHLDLFYVENWTLGLDLAILAATCKTVVTDAAGLLAARHRDRSRDCDRDRDRTVAGAPVTAEAT